MHNNLCILALNSEKLRVKEILLQHMCQKAFPLNTSRIRGKLSYLEVHTTPLFKWDFKRSCWNVQIFQNA